MGAQKREGQKQLECSTEGTGRHGNSNQNHFFSPEVSTKRDSPLHRVACS